MALALPFLTSSPLHVQVRDEVPLPVALHAAGTCLEPEVRLVDGEAEVTIPVVLRVAAEVEGCHAPQPVELRLTLTARVSPGQPFTAVQRLQVALPFHITAEYAAVVEDVRPLDARRVARSVVM